MNFATWFVIRSNSNKNKQTFASIQIYFVTYTLLHLFSRLCLWIFLANVLKFDTFIMQKKYRLCYLTNFCNVSMLHNNRRKFENFLLFLCSPSGAVLNKIEQIKEYLLRHGTCKCGLPCPLRPDFFFEFNPQVISIAYSIIHGIRSWIIDQTFDWFNKWSRWGF